MATILDALVGSCVKKLGELITDNAILILGVQQELKKLQQRMIDTQELLSKADQRRTELEEFEVNNWHKRIKEAMYNAENIIELVTLERNNLLEICPSLSRCTGSSIISCLPNIQRRWKIAAQIRDLNSELEEIKKFYYTIAHNLHPRRQVSSRQQMKTSNLVEPNLLGEEILHACRTLVDQVIAHKDKKAYKLGIVGTGGIGKTTLAQKIYNDHKVNEVFSKKSWICVSRKYSKEDLLKEVLRNFGVHQEQGESFAELTNKLAATVEKEGFFLVLDDVWGPEVWTDVLRTPLHAAAMGIVIITTRHDNVAMSIGVEHMHRVELMSKQVGWELLWRNMGIKEEREVENLRDIGIKIVRKCGGLPLAIKLISRILEPKEKTENQWRKFIEDSGWSKRNFPPELRGALYLSYLDLPPELRSCFLYCAFYPEDSVISRDDLVRFWVAEGFVEEQEGQLLEDIAEEYYYELINRNLLQPEASPFGGVKCKMHDLLRKLAHNIAKEEDFFGHLQSLAQTTSTKLRRCAINTKNDMDLLHSLDKDQIITTKALIILRDKSLKLQNPPFATLPNIRILDLRGAHIESIPNCIRNMLLLRLLDLSTTGIFCLPKCIGSLMNLQTLNLSKCTALHKLPSAITKLCNLRRLGLNGTPINEVPKGIRSLKFLNDLDGFPIDERSDNTPQNGWNLEELEDLSQLRNLKLIRLERASPCINTRPLLENKEHLNFLGLYCSEPSQPTYEDISNVEMTFERLTPPHNLKYLCIKRFFGRSYPNWLSSTNLSSLEQVILQDCKSCMHLPPIGQLRKLKYLKVKGATNVTKIGPELLGFCGDNLAPRTEAVAFPKLEELVIEDMPNWEEWSFVEGDEQVPRMQLLPYVKMVSLMFCPKLRGLPQQFVLEASKLNVPRVKTEDDLLFLYRTFVISSCERLERVSNQLPQIRQLKSKACTALEMTWLST